MSSPRSSRTKNFRWVWYTERIQDASCTGWLSVPNFGMSQQWSDWLEPRIPGILKPSETSRSMSKLRNNLWEQLTREIPTRVQLKNATHWSATVMLNGAVDLNHEFVLFLILVGKHDFSHHLPTIYPPFPNLSIPAALKPAWYPMSSGKGGGGGPGSPCTRHISAVWKPLYGYGSIPINTIFSGMNIHLPAILMWTTGVQGFDTLPYN